MRGGGRGLAIGAGLLLAGCNTVSRGVEEVVTVTATPAFAKIRTSLGHQCPHSPCVVRVGRAAEFTAYAEAPGYRPGSLTVKSELSGQAAPGVLGNAIIPGGS